GGKAVEPRLPYRRFRALDGSLILVGRGPSENDELTFHVANGRDLWLHVAGATGSHVVLSCPPEGGYSEEALLDAAHLAAFFSGLRSEPAADVDYTLRKNVSKPPGLPPGRAVIASRRTLHLRIDRERLDRLLGRRPDFQTENSN
ncbi:MAG: NFACT RNA binding domain-containing protein, partial [Candidatus Glassbacteria bacterium]